MSDDRSSNLFQRALEKRREIETSLEGFSRLLPDPAGGIELLLDRVLRDTGADGKRLRAGFHLKTEPEALHALATSEAEENSHARSALFQRIGECLWRLQYTVEYIGRDWAANAFERCKALRTVLEPQLVANQPSMAQIVQALGTGEAAGHLESGPDATLFAVLRAFKHTHQDKMLEAADADSKAALDYLLKRLQAGIRTGSGFDDVSNAWWAIRVGLYHGDARFREILPAFLQKFSDPILPPQDKLKRSYLPESYQLARIASYMLSNAEAIAKLDAIEESTQKHLRQLIEALTERLLDTPVSEHVYVAAVHHEGLRNFIDFVDHQLSGRIVEGPKESTSKPPAVAAAATSAPKPEKPKPEEAQQVKPAEPSMQRIDVFSRYGLGGLALFCFLEIYLLFINKQTLTEVQGSTVLTATFVVAAMGIIYAAFLSTKNKFIVIVLAAVAVVMGYFVLRPQGGGSAVYTVRVMVEGPSGALVKRPHVWSFLGGEVKVLDNGAAEIVIAQALVGKGAKLKVGAEDLDSGATATGEVVLDSDTVKPMTIRLVARPDETVRGMVVDANGAAVANARVSVVGFGRESVQTDAYGGFELKAHKSSGTIALHAEKAPLGVADEPAYEIGSGPKILRLANVGRRPQPVTPLRVVRTGDAVIDGVLDRLALLNQGRGLTEDRLAGALAPLFDRPAFRIGMREEDWTYFLYILTRTRALIDEQAGRFKNTPNTRERLGNASQKMAIMSERIAKLYGPTFSLTRHVASYGGTRSKFVGNLPSLMERPNGAFFAERDREIGEIRKLVREAGIPISQN
jgi:hypothetical protein